MHIKTYSLATILLVSALPAAAGDPPRAAKPGGDAVLAEIDDLEPGDVEVLGFELDRQQQVRVEALGLGSQRSGHKSYRLAAAWILDAESRKVVWDLAAEGPVDRRGFVEVDRQVRLGAGIYEVYYATYPSHGSGSEGWWQSTARSMARTLGWHDDADYEEMVGDLRLVVRGDGRAIDGVKLEGVRSRLRERALVALAANADHLAESRGFVLDEPLKLLVYAVGEITDDGGYDYGWIIDAESRKKVWTFTLAGSEQSGGMKKNRVTYDTLSLPAGKYAAYFVTDDSHSPESWNALPPHDPSFWGITLWLEDPRQERLARGCEYSHLPGEERAIAELVRMRDSDHRSHGFVLEQPMQVRVYAVGESSGHDMADYGWIMSARTRQKVWSMEYQRTEPAGGAKKNRLADEVIRLEAGSYVVAFVTDDSHAYRDWTAEPPNYPERWGISLFGGEGFERSQVGEYRQDEDSAVLARIARVKSDSHRRRSFTLERATEVSVYALGEGTDDEMYDYAWLEDSAGRVVWEMTYPSTGGAGGASKNRLYNGTLELEGGDYVLHYKSDGSHAYRDWNDSPPHDPDSWGVQVALIE